jgi:hypothetical protein
MISTSRPRRTGHPPVSYRDNSTDDEITNAPSTQSTQTTRRRRATGRRQTSSDGGSDSDSDSSEEFQARSTRRSRPDAGLNNQPLATRSSRRMKNATNYNEDSDQDFTRVETEISKRVRPVPKTASTRRKRPLPTQTISKGPFSAFKRRKINQIDTSQLGKTKSTFATPVIPPGNIPAWQTLPYQILLSILQYASYPFYRDASHDTGSIGWLIGCSTLSKSFHDAAIATLLYSPPLFPADRAHGLQKLLDTPQEILSTSYRNKIKRLDIEVRNLLIKKSGIDLIQFIKQTPLLSALHLYHNYDRVGAVGWAQPAASTGRAYSYPLELFQALDENAIRLKQWSWNGRFPDTKSVLEQMNRMHGRDCLKGLTSLSVSNLAAPGKVKDGKVKDGKVKDWKVKDGKVKEDEKGMPEEFLTTALKMLPYLQELKIQNCSIINNGVLKSMPSHLVQLSIINCGNFNSVDLLSYLTDHGHGLEELILNGNQALDLWFAGSLESLCPRLRVFKMDLTYSDPSAFHDVDPHYEAVFADGVFPTWPRTLQTIKVENLRNLDAEDAERFLGSLIAIAPELKDLRKLCISILLQHDGWRERAQLRQTWMPKLEEIFLRQAPPPAHFIPLSLLPPPFPAMTTSSRPSTSHSNSSSSLTTDDSTAATPNKRKSARIAKRELDGLANEAFQQTKSLRQGKELGRDNASGIEGLRQSMCSEVILHIDGQRPADEQFKEADFLDEELSGDEDWNGRDIEAPSRSRSRNVSRNAW